MKQVRKLTIAATGLAADCLAAGVLSGWPEAVAMSIISIASAFGVYQIPNAPKPT